MTWRAKASAPTLCRLEKWAGRDKTKTIDKLIDQVERIKASVRAKVERPFRVIKQQRTAVLVRARVSSTG